MLRYFDPRVIVLYHLHARVLCIVCFWSSCWQCTSHSGWLQIPTLAIFWIVFGRKIAFPGEFQPGPSNASHKNTILPSPCELSCQMLMDQYCQWFSKFSFPVSHVNCLSYLPAWMHLEYLQLRNLIDYQRQWCMTTSLIPQLPLMSFVFSLAIYLCWGLPYSH